MLEVAAYFREKAEQCRRLARLINDPLTVEELKRMAAEFEEQAAEIEVEESAASAAKED
jgi:hypothetical protein